MLACGGIDDDRDASAADAASNDTTVVDAVDASDLFDVMPTSCPQGGSLQPGAPWPMVNRCPSRESRTNELVAQDPSVKWTVQTSGGGIPSWGYQLGPVVAADGTVYVGGSQLTAVTSTGTVKWTFADASGQTLLAPMVGADGSVYVGTLSGGLDAIDANGSVEWSFAPACAPSLPPYGCLGGFPTIANDGTIYTEVNNGGIDTLNAVSSNGQVRWSYVPTGANPPGDVDTITITYDGTVVFDHFYELVALSPTGSLDWTWTSGSAPTQASVGAPSVGSDGTIYVVTANPNALHAIGSNGVEIWEYDLGSSFYANGTAPTIAADGTVYVGGGGGLQAVKAGLPVWGFDFDLYGEVFSPTSISGDGTLYASNSVGVFALSPSGSELWTIKTPTAIPWFGVAIGTSGVLYTVDEDSVLYAIGP